MKKFLQVVIILVSLLLIYLSHSAINASNDNVDITFSTQSVQKNDTFIDKITSKTKNSRRSKWLNLSTEKASETQQDQEDEMIEDIYVAPSSKGSKGGSNKSAECNDRIDNDGDGYCDASNNSKRCKDGSIAGDPDCDSRSDNSESGCTPHAEICDNRDNDCDGQIDEGLSCGCFNNIQDNNETDVDCGGSCGPCAIGDSCELGTDCVTNYCDQGVCSQSVSPSCQLLYGNQQETNNRFNLVFVPSGFEGDMQSFKTHVDKMIEEFQEYHPLKESELINYFIFEKESGAFCQSSCNGIDRLLCCDTSYARSLSSSCTNTDRQTIVVHNTEQYGGAGYTYAEVATTSLHPAGSKVVVHELGHSLFKLGDEYSYASAGSTPSLVPNCENKSCDGWSDLIGADGVGCERDSCYQGKYYKAENSIMNTLDQKYEESNLRFSCCAYLQELGATPTYCDQFDGKGPRSLENYCSDYSFAAPDINATPLLDEYVYVQNYAGERILSDILPRNTHKTPQNKTYGDIAITVEGNGNSIKRKETSTIPVESPKNELFLDGYSKVPTRVIKIPVDRKKFGQKPRIIIEQQP